MKKVLLLLVVAIAAISCNRSESVLYATRVQIENQCPMVVDEITTLKNVSYNINDQFFIYNYTIDESKCPMSVIKDQIDQIAENIKSTISNPLNKEFLEACINANVSIMYKYNGNESGETCLIIYYPKSKEMEIRR